VTRLAYTREEAAAALGVSVDYFDEHVPARVEGHLPGPSRPHPRPRDRAVDRAPRRGRPPALLEGGMKLQDAEKLARELMDLHGLADWTFEFDNCKTSLGSCCCGRRTISLSRPLLELNDDEDLWRETILHEIAHAKLPMGVRGHGAEWKEMARSVGAKPERCCGEDDGVIHPAPTWIGRCPKCEEIRAEKYRRLEVSCGHCADEFDPAANERGRTPPSEPVRHAGQEPRSASALGSRPEIRSPLQTSARAGLRGSQAGRPARRVV
jgi:predicted SprT family Zn-dependent metalloprotease